MITGSLQRQPYAMFAVKYNQRYSPPVFPLIPLPNSSFPEALSRSLLEIAENQSRTIDTMKANQEVQAAAYKEMTKTNKMRDDDALFHCFTVGNGLIPLILLTGSTYFVEKLNINCELWILIGWINKSDNRIGNDQSADTAQNL